MKKLKKNNYIHLIILSSILLTYFIVVICLGYKFGSMTDWISQHFRIPEYFRTLFYETKEIFPDFAFNLGGGQNIYYLAYHGFLNPITILAYLFPFIKMVDFMVIFHLLTTLASVYLLYYWLNNKYNSKIAFITSFMFLLASPLVYHMHRHLMFVNYMPFLILALMGVDKFFENGSKKLLIISTTLIIFSSYFYSVGALLAIVLYGIQVYFHTRKDKTMKNFAKNGLKFALTIIIPILISAILLLPTIYALLNGRNPTNSSINYLTMFIPKIDSRILLYNSYALGLTMFSVLALIENSMNKKYRIMTICLLVILIFPIFVYALNGFMYYDGKALIPFLPIFCLLIGSSLDNLFANKIKLNKLLIIFGIISIITILYNLKFEHCIVIIIDAILLIISLFLFETKKKQWIIISYILFSTSVSFLIINISDALVTNKYYEQIENKNEEQFVEIIDNDLTFFRTNNLNNILPNVNNVLSNNYYTTSFYSSVTNNHYTNFVRNIFKNEIYNKDYATLTASSNVLFNIYMGNKYIISDYDLKGYTLIKNGEFTNLYQNNDVFKVGYATKEKMSLREFNNLAYPYTMDALLNYAIVDEEIDDVYKTNIIEETINFTLEKENNLEIIDDENIVFNAKENAEITLKLEKPINDILIIEFDMLHNNPNYNSAITINNVTNALSFKGWKYHNKNYRFHYVISSNETINELKILIDKGHYEIANIKTYTFKYDSILDIKHDDFIVDKEKTSGDNIVGTINVTDKEYFILNIPYDKGFKIYVDGENQKYEIANTSFIGFNIDKGIHSIQIIYEAPFKKLGSYISLFGVIILIIICFKERKYNHEKN